jgi:Cytochrome c554 and c-prime
MRNELALRMRVYAAGGLLLAASAFLGACPRTEDVNPLGFENTTDKTNAAARFVGSSACVQCHAEIAATHAQHGHAQVLKAAQGAAPEYPAAAARAGVPAPPAGMAWTDVAYVVGGYRKAARFVSQDGYLLTGADTQWNLSFPPNGTSAGFAAYRAGDVEPAPYDFSCFRCHTTGPAFDAAALRNQDGRPGIAGTWNEIGVQCEACHGPGGGHFQTTAGNVFIDTGRVFVDADGSRTCAECHNRPFDDRSGAILAGDGFILNQGQWPELRASGGHSEFACTVCHDPHRSLAVDRDAALRNTCTACHRDATMAGHGRSAKLRELPHALRDAQRAFRDRRDGRPARPHGRHADAHFPHQHRGNELQRHANSRRRPGSSRFAGPGGRDGGLRLPALPQRVGAVLADHGAGGGDRRADSRIAVGGGDVGTRYPPNLFSRREFS